ncbi:MAG: hypothetical protein K6G22_08060 [Lachnospiraceae bacterium]|nr:hypothetical protein [Lachnospiraceae bacterium]
MAKTEDLRGLAIRNRKGDMAKMEKTSGLAIKAEKAIWLRWKKQAV